MDYLALLQQIRRNNVSELFCLKDVMPILGLLNISQVIRKIPKEMQGEDVFVSSHNKERRMNAITLQGLFNLCQRSNNEDLIRASFVFYHQALPQSLCEKKMNLIIDHLNNARQKGDELPEFWAQFLN